MRIGHARRGLPEVERARIAVERRRDLARARQRMHQHRVAHRRILERVGVDAQVLDAVVGGVVLPLALRARHVERVERDRLGLGEALAQIELGVGEERQLMRACAGAR